MDCTKLGYPFAIPDKRLALAHDGNFKTTFVFTGDLAFDRKLVLLSHANIVQALVGTTHTYSCEKDLTTPTGNNIGADFVTSVILLLLIHQLIAIDDTGMERVNFDEDIFDEGLMEEISPQPYRQRPNGLP